MKRKEMMAQGDILLVEVGAVPKGAELVSDGIVARGEATGHMHRLAERAKLYRLSGEMFIDGRQGGSLRHEEHGTLPLDRVYRVVIQREFDGKYSRMVQD